MMRAGFSPDAVFRFGQVARYLPSARLAPEKACTANDPNLPLIWYEMMS